MLQVENTLAANEERDAVRWLHQVVVGRLGEREREHTLLLQVRLVDAGERLDNDGAAAEVARLERGVLA